MTYNRKCPVCGKENRGLYLDETGGRMTCEYCGMDIQFRNKTRTKRVPASVRRLKTYASALHSRNER